MPEIASGGANAAQETYWNSDVGTTWAQRQESLDQMHEGVTETLIGCAAPIDGEKVLDVGCGAGATSMAVAAAVGPTGSVLGIDISSPLLDRAEERRKQAGLEQVQYVLTDAQTHPFAEGEFDLVVSRLGVMFFSDPVAAFQNLLSALRPGGRMALAAWAEAAGNPWFTLPGRAAASVLGEPPPSEPRAAGPLAFAETDYVLGILRKAGFAECAARTEDVHLFNPGGLDAVTQLATVVGPAARILRLFEGGPEDAAEIGRRIAQSLGKYVVDDGIRIPARVNIFTAARA
jgi:SAM-dependent methyltransferase